MLPARSSVTWWEFALLYVDMKWPSLAPISRRSMAEALVTATMALLDDAKKRPRDSDLRAAMTAWAFNSKARAAGPPPAHLAASIAWLQGHTVPLESLGKAINARALLEALTRKLDGTLAAPTTVARKRALIHNAFEFAVEQEVFPANPIARVRWKAPKVRDSFDPRTVISPHQARALLDAVGNLDVAAYREGVQSEAAVTRPGGARLPARGASAGSARLSRIVGLDVRGRHLVAFFACMYYSALRPSEAIALAVNDLDLPSPADPGDGWGQLLLSGGNPEIAGTWTDSGKRSPRQLKHRARDTVRAVPAPPPLVAHLRAHVAEYGTTADGRLFRGAYGAPVSTESYSQVWQAARRQVLTPAECASPLARRPYDLRHTAVSTWLAAGVDSTQVASWAGHSVAVLHRVYAHTLAGRDDVARARIAAVLEPSNVGN
ncbi:MAG: tyrosine-type recombinase/integrase [Actinobacteria bacterium]|nr:tyrosine-type recombinase/integrase [Actinomycetota bacterium]